MPCVRRARPRRDWPSRCRLRRPWRWRRRRRRRGGDVRRRSSWPPRHLGVPHNRQARARACRRSPGAAALCRASPHSRRTRPGWRALPRRLRRRWRRPWRGRLGLARPTPWPGWRPPRHWHSVNPPTRLLPSPSRCTAGTGRCSGRPCPRRLHRSLQRPWCKQNGCGCSRHRRRRQRPPLWPCRAPIHTAPFQRRPT